MKPVDQSILHDPPNGIFGDCQRAVIASLLELPLLDVPHFGQDGCDGQTFERRIAGFLAPFGLGHLEIQHPSFVEVLKTHGWPPGTFHALYGPSPRFDDMLHAVVGKDGLVAHDPHPSRAGLAPGEWTVGLLVRRA